MLPLLAILLIIVALQGLQTSNTSEKPSLKRKRDHEFPHPSLPRQDAPHSKQPRTSAQSTIDGPQSQESKKNINTSVVDPLKSWVLKGNWPSEFFEPDDQTREDLLEHNSWREEQVEHPPPPTVQYAEINGFRYPRPIKKKTLPHSVGSSQIRA